MGPCTGIRIRGREFQNSMGIFTVSTLFSIAFIRSMFPYGIPLYSMIAGVLLFYTIVISTLSSRMIVFPKNLRFFYLLQIYFIFAIVLSDRFYNGLRKDVFNIIGINIFIVSAFYFIKDEASFNRFKKNTIFIIFFASAYISFIGLIKYVLSLRGIQLHFFAVRSQYPWGSSLVLDYNYYALAHVIGLLCALYIFIYGKGIAIRVMTSLSLILISANIILSGSRRAVFFLIIIISITILYTLIKMNGSLFSALHGKKMYNKMDSKRIINNLIIILLFVCLSALILSKIEIIQLINKNTTVEGKIYRRVSSVKQFQSAIHPRIERYLFTEELLENSLLMQIIFGNGFEYLREFGQRRGSGSGESYPHNIVLSALLYGGIINVLLFLIYLIQTMHLYLKKIRYLDFYFFCFIIFLLSSMISGNTFFSLRRLCLLSILPFLELSCGHELYDLPEKGFVKLKALSQNWIHNY